MECNCSSEGRNIMRAALKPLVLNCSAEYQKKKKRFKGLSDAAATKQVSEILFPVTMVTETKCLRAKAQL